MTKHECRMTKKAKSCNDKNAFEFRHSFVLGYSSFVIFHICGMINLQS
jgi:hypothetical protein